jgi:hypothetical protein
MISLSSVESAPRLVCLVCDLRAIAEYCHTRSCYALGAGRASEQLAKMEIDKVRYVTERDRQSLEIGPSIDRA